MQENPAPPSESIHVSRQGAVIGHFSLAELRRGLAAGTILRTDYYWKAGMQGWRRVGAVFDVKTSAQGVPPPPKPVEVPAAPAAQAVSGSSGTKVKSPRFAWLSLGLFAILVALLQGHCYFTLKAPLAKVLRSDSRNRGIEASAYFQYAIPGGSIVLDIDSIRPDLRPVDMLRVMLQFAETQQHTNCEWVILASRGRERFKMRGSYFRKLGADYDFQNPLYTMRTMPENLHRMDGRNAFPEWEGGALAVMGEQMKNFSEFIGEWLR